ncbi:thioredoxin family protein [Reichenbachiella sp.]|uniref:thioredoxin family protein n=1 Tax=Reichenbachiella sp. TaxID=2184521 RepID=UPI003BAF880F
MLRLILGLWMVVMGWFPLSTDAQPAAYTFDQLDSLQQASERNVVVFIHTDWCKFCQTMKNTTLQNQEVESLLNENFWFISLNAEYRGDIILAGRTFSFKPTGAGTGVHELAEELGRQQGELSYPSLCILDSDLQILFQYDQLMSVRQMKEVLEGIKE